MEDKNIKVNLFVKQVNQSNALAHKPDYLAYAANYNFLLLENDKLRGEIAELKELIYKLADID
jgi:hypothetical protein